MRSSSLKVLLLSSAVVAAMCFAVVVKDASPFFSVTISGPQSVKAGSAAKVDIAVTNTSSSTTVFGSGYREDEAEFGFDFSVLSSEGKPASHTRYMKAVKGEPQGPGPQLDIGRRSLSTRLAPGEAMKSSADLNKLFVLPPGRYTVQASHREGAYDESANVPTNRDTVPNWSASHPATVVKSNTIVLTVVP